MASKFWGAIGYGHQEELKPGDWSDVIVERTLFCEIRRASRRLQEGENLNKDITLQNSISVVADAYANDNWMNIKYVVWAGQPWTVDNVEIEAPRLTLRLGGIYNGPRPVPAETPVP